MSLWVSACLRSAQAGWLGATLFLVAASAVGQAGSGGGIAMPAGVGGGVPAVEHAARGVGGAAALMHGAAGAGGAAAGVIAGAAGSAPGAGAAGEASNPPTRGEDREKALASERAELARYLVLFGATTALGLMGLLGYLAHHLARALRLGLPIGVTTHWGGFGNSAGGWQISPVLAMLLAIGVVAVSLTVVSSAITSATVELLGPRAEDPAPAPARTQAGK